MISLPTAFKAFTKKVRSNLVEDNFLKCLKLIKKNLKKQQDRKKKQSLKKPIFVTKMTANVKNKLLT